MTSQDEYETQVRSTEEFLSMAAEHAENGDLTEERNLLLAAQVHATLALAAATRDTDAITVREDRP